ncbi:hypothetical protein HK101_010968, partial [Irineochytrium annulatum]
TNLADSGIGEALTISVVEDSAELLAAGVVGPSDARRGAARPLRVVRNMAVASRERSTLAQLHTNLLFPPSLSEIDAVAPLSLMAAREDARRRAVVSPKLSSIPRLQIRTPISIRPTTTSQAKSMGFDCLAVLKPEPKPDPTAQREKEPPPNTKDVASIVPTPLPPPPPPPPPPPSQTLMAAVRPPLQPDLVKPAPAPAHRPSSDLTHLLDLESLLTDDEIMKIGSVEPWGEKHADPFSEFHRKRKRPAPAGQPSAVAASAALGGGATGGQVLSCAAIGCRASGGPANCGCIAVTGDSRDQGGAVLSAATAAAVPSNVGPILLGAVMTAAGRARCASYALEAGAGTARKEDAGAGRKKEGGEEDGGDMELKGLIRVEGDERKEARFIYIYPQKLKTVPCAPKEEDDEDVLPERVPSVTTDADGVVATSSVEKSAVSRSQEGVVDDAAEVIRESEARELSLACERLKLGVAADGTLKPSAEEEGTAASDKKRALATLTIRELRKIFPPLAESSRRHSTPALGGAGGGRLGNLGGKLQGKLRGATLAGSLFIPSSNGGGDLVTNIADAEIERMPKYITGQYNHPLLATTTDLKPKQFVGMSQDIKSMTHFPDLSKRLAAGEPVPPSQIYPAGHDVRAVSLPNLVSSGGPINGVRIGTALDLMRRKPPREAVTFSGAKAPPVGGLKTSLTDTSGGSASLSASLAPMRPPVGAGSQLKPGGGSLVRAGNGIDGKALAMELWKLCMRGRGEHRILNHDDLSCGAEAELLLHHQEGQVAVSFAAGAVDVADPMPGADEHRVARENFELKADLNSEYKEKRKETVKKVIANMTIGKDVSSLFADVVKNMQTEDLELKKLVYLYLINYAKSQPELVILAVNTFVKDTDDMNPLIRALAIRTMGCLRVERIVDYLLEPLKKGLKDEDPYVRKTAALCVAKLFDLNPATAIDNGLISILQDMLSDRNPMVIANAVAALSEINETSSKKDIFSVNNTVLIKLLAALNECTEWGQICILSSLATYRPVDVREAAEITERVVARLQHANASVVLTAVRVLMIYLNFIGEDLTKQVIRKMAPPLVTLLSSEPEIQYVALRNINLILQKRPDVLNQEMRVFFTKYNDPPYVKLEKLEVIIKLCSDANIDQVLSELKEYASEVDVGFVRQSVRAIGRCAVKIESASERCVNVLLELIKTKVNYVVQESVVVIKDIFRKYPSKYEGIIPSLCDNIESLDEPDAKASLIWIIGEYAERIENADELLEFFIENFKEESSNVQLQLLTATVKLFLKKPGSAQEIVQKILQSATQNCENPDIRDRAYVYWRLLSSTPQAAKAVVLAEKPPIEADNNSVSETLLDELILNIGSLASVYHKPPALLGSSVGTEVLAPREPGILEDGEAEEAEGAANVIKQVVASGGNIDNLLDLDFGGPVATQTMASGATSSPSVQTPKVSSGIDDLLGLVDMGSSSSLNSNGGLGGGMGGSMGLLGSGFGSSGMLASAPAKAEAGPRTQLLSAGTSKGLDLYGSFAKRNGKVFFDLSFSNQSQDTLSDFAIQFNVNT